jgi:RNA recognition motif-containing protein
MGMSLGFGYVAMASMSEAHAAIEALNGKCLAESSRPRRGSAPPASSLTTLKPLKALYRPSVMSFRKQFFFH